MRKLAAVVFCLVCAQGTVTADQRTVINSAVVDQVSGVVLVYGQFGSNPSVTIDGMLVRVVNAAPQVVVVELPASLRNQPGTYLLTATANDGWKTGVFVIAVGAIGPQGPQGLQGLQGPQGPRGDDGQRGERGEPGPAGAKGETGDKGDPGAAGAAGSHGDKGDKGDPGTNGTNGTNGLNGADGAKGDKGDKGDTGNAGPAGAGSLRVVDANGKDVGTFVSPDAVIVNIGSDWVRISLRGAGFVSCSTGSVPCLMYQFEQPDCAGTVYMHAEIGLAQPAFVIDNAIHYPSGAVAERPVASLRYDSGACINVGGGFTDTNAEWKSAPQSSLGLSGAFHLAR